MLIEKMTKNLMMFSTVSAQTEDSPKEKEAQQSFTEVKENASPCLLDLVALMGVFTGVRFGYIVASTGYYEGNRKMQLAGAMLMLAGACSVKLACDYQPKTSHVNKP